MTAVIEPSKVKSLKGLSNLLGNIRYWVPGSLSTEDDESLLSSNTPFGNESTSIPKSGDRPEIEIVERFLELLDLELKALLISVRDEIYEDGIEGVLVQSLEEFVLRFGDYGIRSIEKFSDLSQINLGSLSEFLLILGEMDDAKTYESRFWLLVHHLFHPNPSVRDSSAVGMAYFKDIRAIPFLEEQLVVEDCKEITLGIKQVLEKLIKR